MKVLHIAYFTKFKINVVVYGKLRVCVRGFSEGHERSELASAKSEASKRATTFGLAKTSNFYILCWQQFLFFFHQLAWVKPKHKFIQVSIRDKNRQISKVRFRFFVDIFYQSVFMVPQQF